MGTLQVGGTTLATKNSSTGKVDLNSTNTAFPAGMVVGFNKFAGVDTRQISVTTFTGSATNTGSALLVTFEHTPKATGNIIWLSASTAGYTDDRSMTGRMTWMAGATSSARSSDVDIYNTATSSGGMGTLSASGLWTKHEYGGTANDDFPWSGDVTGWWTAQNTNSITFTLHGAVSTSFMIVQRQTATLMEIQQ